MTDFWGETTGYVPFEVTSTSHKSPVSGITCWNRVTRWDAVGAGADGATAFCTVTPEGETFGLEFALFASALGSVPEPLVFGATGSLRRIQE